MEAVGGEADAFVAVPVEIVEELTEVLPAIRRCVKGGVRMEVAAA